MNSRTFHLILGYFSICICVLVRAQYQQGFISIDCGASASYTDATTGLVYTTDEQYITTGVNSEVQAPYKEVNETQFLNLRTFPNGSRNCYTFNLPQLGKYTRYLIRARFLYGDYDSKNILPRFDLYAGVKYWETIHISDASVHVTKELMYVPTSSTVYICLVNLGLGTPFISALELRTHEHTFYDGFSLASLSVVKRVDFGNANRQIRYPNDNVDRIWEPYLIEEPNMKYISTSFPENATFLLEVPRIVMETALTPAYSIRSLKFNWKLPLPAKDDSRHIYLHFAEVENISQPKQIREFSVMINNNEPMIIVAVGGYATLDTLVRTQVWLNISMVQTKRSTLPPIINAIEVYNLRAFNELETQQLDALAIKNIRQTYKIAKDWIADPCAPQNHSWEGLVCSFDGTIALPRIISLNLSSSNLMGNISEDIFNLKVLEILDLSENNLSGLIPDFLSNLKFLRVLNLSGNKLSGTIPVGLRKRSQQGTLLLRVEGNEALCVSESCPTTDLPATDNKKKASSVLIISLTSGCALLLLLGITALVWKCRKGNKSTAQGEVDLAGNTYHTEGKLNSSEDQNVKVNRHISFMAAKKRFTYSDILHITNNFQKVLGEGGFGTVFYGKLDNSTEVAVKMLKPTLSDVLE